MPSARPAARRPLLRRAAADRDRRQGVVRGLGPPGPGGAAVGPERRAGGGRAPRRDVRGNPGPRRAGRPRAGDPAPRAAAHLPGAAHRGEHRGREARRREGARLAGPGRSASPRARPTGSSSSGAPSTGGSPGRCSTGSSSARFPRPTPSPSPRGRGGPRPRPPARGPRGDPPRPALRRGLVEAPKKNTYFVLFNCRSGPAAARAELRRALAGTVRAPGPRLEDARPLRGAGDEPHPAGHARARPGPAAAPPSPARKPSPCSRRRGVEAPARLRASVHPLFHDRYAALLAALRASGESSGSRSRWRRPTWPPTSTRGRRATASTS